MAQRSARVSAIAYRAVPHCARDIRPNGHTGGFGDVRGSRPRGFEGSTSVRTYGVADRVIQAQYGTGTITATNEYHTVIDFDEHGVRTFATPLIQLERSTTVAPVKPTPSHRRKRTAR